MSYCKRGLIQSLDQLLHMVFNEILCIFSEFQMGDGDIFIIVIATVPAQVSILTAYNTQKNSVFLEWGSPLQTNGILIGYLLQYHLGAYLPLMT